MPEGAVGRDLCLPHASLICVCPPYLSMVGRAVMVAGMLTRQYVSSGLTAVTVIVMVCVDYGGIRGLWE